MAVTKKPATWLQQQQQHEVELGGKYRKYNKYIMPPESQTIAKLFAIILFVTNTNDVGKMVGKKAQSLCTFVRTENCITFVARLSGFKK
jgi:hypothetical protein